MGEGGGGGGGGFVELSCRVGKYRGFFGSVKDMRATVLNVSQSQSEHGSTGLCYSCWLVA